MPLNSPRRSGARRLGSHFAELLEPRVLLAAVSWDGGGGDGQWTNPLNWSNDALPGLADDVTVAAATVNLASGAPQSVNSFTFAPGAVVTLRASLATASASRVEGTLVLENGAALTGAGDVTIAGRLDQTSVSVLSGTGDTVIDSGGIFEVRPVSFDARLSRHVTVEAGGSILFSPSIDGTFWIVQGGQIENHGQLTVRGVPPVSGFYNWGVSVSGADPSLLTNYGTVTIDPIFAGFWTVPLVNHGTFEVARAAVTFNIGSVTNHGVMRAMTGTSIQFSTSNVQHLSGASLEGAGLITFGGPSPAGTRTFAAGTFNPTGEVSVGSGTIEVNEPFTGFTLRDNAIGAATLIFSTPQAFDGLDLRRGSIFSSANVTLTGTTTWDGDGVLGGTGKFIVPSGATLRMTQEFGINSNKRLHGTLELAGTLIRDGGGIVMNNGTLHVKPGGTFFDACHTNSLTPDIRSSGGTNVVINEGTFNKQVTGTWQFAAANGGVRFDSTGQVNIVRGTLVVAGGGTNSGATSVGGGAALVHNAPAGYTYAPGAGIAGPGTVHFEAGANTVGGAVSGVASVSVSGGATARFDAALTITGALTATGNTTRATLAGDARVANLVADGGARIDLTDRTVIVDYVGGTPLPDIRADLTGGYNGGAWNGAGIMSSTAGASSANAVGFAEAFELFSQPTTFEGQPIDDSTVIVRYTRYGDANLDRVVNLDDFNRLAARFGQLGTTWVQGNFNYDNATNLDDFNLLAAHFGQSASPQGVARTR